MRFLAKIIFMLMIGTGFGLFVPFAFAIVYPESFRKEDAFFIIAGVGAGLLSGGFVGIWLFSAELFDKRQKDV